VSAGLADDPKLTGAAWDGTRRPFWRFCVINAPPNLANDTTHSIARVRHRGKIARCCVQPQVTAFIRVKI